MEFDKNPISLSELMKKKIIRFIPIQPSQRNKFMEFTMGLFYALDYIIMFLVIIISLNKTKIQVKVPELDDKQFIISLIICILFIITKLRIILVLNKIIMIVLFFINEGKFDGQYDGSFFINVLTVIIWGLTIEQRKVHFDSRFQLQYPITKQILFYSIFIILKIPSLNTVVFYNLVIAFISFSWILLDYFDTIYIKKVRNIFLLFDIWLLHSSLIPIVYDVFLNITINYFTILKISLICLVLVIGILFFDNNQQNLVPTHNINMTSSVSDNQLLQYYLRIDSIIDSKNEETASKFIYTHKSLCSNFNCFLIVKQHDIKISSIELLHLYLENQVKIQAKKRYIFQKFFIFRFFNSYNASFNFQWRKGFFFERELYRIQKEKKKKKDKKQKKILELAMKKSLWRLNDKRASSYMKELIKIGKKFWFQIFHNKINAQKLFKKGVKMIQIMNKLQKLKKQNISIINEEKINYLKNYLLRQKTPESERFQEYEFEYDIPMMIVSAQETDFMHVVNVNSAVERDLGFTKSQLLTKTIDDFLELDFRIHHHYFMEKKSKYGQFDGTQKKIPCAFLKNKEEYHKFYETIIYTLNDIAGKKWCVFLKPIFKEGSAFIIDANQMLVGFNQNALAFGMKKQMIGNIMKEQILLKTLKKKIGLKIQENISIFDEKNYHFSKKVKLKIIQSIYFDNSLYYYIIELKASNQISKGSIRGSVEASQLLSHTFKSSDLMNKRSFQSSRSLPKDKPHPEFEFDWDLNGSIKNKEREQILDKKLKKKEKKTFYLLQEKEQQIQEMRLWEDKIDFIENMKNLSNDIYEEDNPFMDKKRVKVFQEEQFKHFYQIRIQQKLPINYIQTRSFYMIVAFILIGLLSSLSYVLISNIDLIESKILSQENINRLSHDYVFLGALTILKNYPRYDDKVEQKINKTVLEIKDKYSYLHNQNNKILQQYLNGQSLNQIDQNYQLLLNEYLNSDAKNETKILNYIIEKIQPIWSIVREEDFKSNNIIIGLLLKNILILIGVMSIILLIIIIPFHKLIKRIKKNDKELVDIFANLKTSLIKIQYNKLVSFQKYVCFDMSLIDQDLIEDRPEDHEQHLYKKKPANLPTLKMITYLFIGCLFSVFIYGIIILVSQCSFNYVSESVLSIEKHFTNMIIASQMVWVGLNKFPNDIDKIDMYQQILYDSQNKFRNQLIRELRKKVFSDDFKQFFLSFWVGNACPYFKVKNCQVFLNGAIKDGVSQIIAYMNRKIDFLMHKSFEETQFRSLSSIDKLITIQQDYLRQISLTFSKNLKQEILKIKHKISIRIYGSLAVLTIFSIVCAILSYKMLTKHIFKLRSMEKLFMYLPYKELSKVKEFNMFINRRKEEEID